MLFSLGDKCSGRDRCQAASAGFGFTSTASGETRKMYYYVLLLLHNERHMIILFLREHCRTNKYKTLTYQYGAYKSIVPYS